MKNKYLFTSESVTEGHPDKMCDIISDAILDGYMKADPKSRVACEVTATTGIITVMGEITSSANIEIVNIVRAAVKDIGYADDTFGFNGDTCAVVLNIDKQSSDIDMGVSRSLECKKNSVQEDKSEFSEDTDKEVLGAGDQGMMFGYACNETDNHMPTPIHYAHKLCHRLSQVRKNKDVDYLGPDGKSMVTVEYIDGNPIRIDTVVISSQHKADISQERIYKDMLENVILPVIPKELIDDNTVVLVNPTGRFVAGGPCADTGLTGRKIIVDTYGGMGRHGGGAFSGKDPTKVDRTGAYAARYVAKNIVAANIATKCEVQIAYVIGVANPVSIHVNTFGTSSIEDSDIAIMIKRLFDLRPSVLIERFKMRNPIFKNLASYGHIGRSDLDVEWEKTDMIEEIKEYFRMG